MYTEARRATVESADGAIADSGQTLREWFCGWLGLWHADLICLAVRTYDMYQPGSGGIVVSAALYLSLVQAACERRRGR
jgi:hypothetical protein